MEPDLARTPLGRNQLAITANSQAILPQTAHTLNDKVLGKAQSTKRNRFH